MKYALLTFAFLFVGFAQAQQDQKATKPASGLKFTSTEIVRENIPYDSKDMFVFEFKNTSKKSITVSNVQTSCGCTAAEKPSEPIKKGKKGVIKVTYDTKRVGAFTKTITVFSDGGDPVVLTIRGTVLSPADSPTTN
ncbi:MAG: hypothetical protein RLZZ30_497 [Bacteroidota bacterium]|jgi:hypothetical protein